MVTLTLYLLTWGVLGDPASLEIFRTPEQACAVYVTKEDNHHRMLWRISLDGAEVLKLEEGTCRPDEPVYKFQAK